VFHYIKSKASKKNLSWVASEATEVKSTLRA